MTRMAAAGVLSVDAGEWTLASVARFRRHHADIARCERSIAAPTRGRSSMLDLGEVQTKLIRCR